MFLIELISILTMLFFAFMTITKLCFSTDKLSCRHWKVNYVNITRLGYMLSMPKNLIFWGAFLRIVKFFIQLFSLMTRMSYHMMLRLRFYLVWYFIRLYPVMTWRQDMDNMSCFIQVLTSSRDFMSRLGWQDKPKKF